ncbi:DUF47 family protein [Bacillota bacterium LX-D]|nr:DUF47 family protein [Bacillota bacterium LX-D]
MFNLSPKDDKFYDFFIAMANTTLKSAQLLKELVQNLNDCEDRFKKIKEIEHECDQLTHNLFGELNKTFITPIDREDIYAIAKQMDDIVDFIESTASRFAIFNLAKTTKEANIISDLILACAKEQIHLMEELKIMKKSKMLTKKIIEINRIEEEGDAVYRVAIKDLFSGEIPVLEVIKWKEIYENLESILDAFEDVANSVEGVVMKNA